MTNNGSNAVSVTKSGPATLVYDGANTYSGGTTVGAGTLQVAAGGSLIGGGAVTVSGGGPASGYPPSGSAAFNVSGGTVSTSNSGNAFYLGNIAGQTGVVNVSAGNVVDHQWQRVGLAGRLRHGNLEPDGRHDDGGQPVLWRQPDRLGRRN